MSISLKQKAYNIIKERILQCKYPPNALLNEEMLSDELKMSRTPIRDALGRLEQESLVQILPKKGFMVTEISLVEAEKVYEIRMLIEPYLLENYGGLVEEKQFKIYEELFSRDVRQVSLDDIFIEDDDFHNLFLDASKNQYFMQAYKYVNAQNKRLRAISGHYGIQRLERSQREHLLIVQACIAKDWQKASAKLKSHLNESRKVLHNIAVYEKMK